MDDKCQIIDTVYDCRVTSPEPRKLFFRLAEGKWKPSIITIKSHSITNDIQIRRLFQVVWYLKETLDVTPNLKWSVVRCATPYTNISKKFLLHLSEKLVIISYRRQQELLNKRSDLFWKCRHENK